MQEILILFFFCLLLGENYIQRYSHYGCNYHRGLGEDHGNPIRELGKGFRHLADSYS